MNTSYAVNLSFGMWRNQIWFAGAEGSAEQFELAKKALSDVCADCANSSEFFEKAQQHFESHGFVRICK